MTKKSPKSFNLMRYAMGFDWQPYRSGYQWFTLRDILSGQDESWDDLASSNPSVAKSINEMVKSYKSYIDKFIDRYKVDEKQLESFYNVYAGHHPAYGAYMVGVGPYAGPKQQDAENKFGYFTQRFASTNTRSVMALWYNFIRRHEPFKAAAEALGVEDLTKIIAPEDCVLDVKHRESPESLSTVYETIDLTPEYLASHDYENIQASNEEAQISGGETKPLPNSTVIGVGSEFKLKPYGVMKILAHLASSSGTASQLGDILMSVAQEMNIPPDQISQSKRANSDFMKSVCAKYSEIEPASLKLESGRRAGSQRSEALKPSREQTRSLKLMKEICGTINEMGSEDPTLISDKMNSRRPKKKGKATGSFTPDIIYEWIDRIRVFRQDHDENGNISSVKDYGEMFQEFGENLEDLHSGFDDMETVLKIASLRFAEVDGSEIDSKTGAKLSIIPSMFGGVPDNVNMTSADLTEMRLGEGIQPIIQEEDVTEEIPIEEDLGNTVIEDEEIDEGIDIKKPSVKIPAPHAQVEVEEEEEEQVMARTLNGLMKVAKNLKNNGNKGIALKIEKFINKYEKGIKL